MTGVTPRQCATTVRPLRIRWCAVLDEIQKALGTEHDVVRRAVLPGDDLSEFDAVWLASSTYSSFGAQHRTGHLWAARWAVDHGLPLAVYMDDWQTKAVFGDWRKIAENGPREIWRTIEHVAPRNRGDVDRHVGELVEAAGMLVDPLGPAWRTSVVALAVFAWGDPTLITADMDYAGDGVTIARFDPTPFYLEHYQANAPEPRRRVEAWMMAGLSDGHWSWVNKQGLRWPVESYGPGKRAAGGVLPDEIAVMDKYAEYWGALVPGYYHSGSGWFRPRFLTAGIVGTPILCDSHDAARMATFGATAFEPRGPAVEAMDWRERVEFAGHQWEDLMSIVETDPIASREAVLRALEPAAVTA